MQEYNIPTVTNRFETFDIDLFNSEVDPISGKRTLISSENHIEEEAQNPGYIRRIYNKNSYFKIHKFFYNNGNIKTKVILFNNGSPYGIVYEFSEDGKLIKETNYNQPKYKIGWNYILSYCKEHNIPLTKGYTESGFHTSIYFDKDVEKEHGIWTIKYQIAGDKLEEIKLHGNSGYEISKKELGFIGP